MLIRIPLWGQSNVLYHQLPVATANFFSPLARAVGYLLCIVCACVSAHVCVCVCFQALRDTAHIQNLGWDSQLASREAQGLSSHLAEPPRQSEPMGTPVPPRPLFDELFPSPEIFPPRSHFHKPNP